MTAARARELLDEAWRAVANSKLVEFRGQCCGSQSSRGKA
jgi:hypothetical protein